MTDTIICGTCEYFDKDWIIEDDPAESRGLCDVPLDLLPLSMRRTALREKESVGPLWPGCPTHSLRVKRAAAEHVKVGDETPVGRVR